ncbi:MAG: dTDP-4-amino-4,6-dideoxygalactose transaminase [Chitinophagales bacterium]
MSKRAKIPFNQAFLTGKETTYIEETVGKKHLSGNGFFTKKCHHFFETKYRFRKCLLTTSCTDALEMAALLLDIQAGDEVIMPSYTFVSTANAFVLRGAKIVFVDSCSNHPNLDPTRIEALISPKTKAIIVVHYAGAACDMETIMAIAQKHHLFVVEDAAQGIDSYYKNKPLGGIGHLAAFSFHETKNIQCGEGGMLVINDERFVKRAEIIWEKGTNRAAFFRGEINKYGWVDVGSSFLPSEITAAFLLAQLEQLEDIQQQRKRIWQAYFDALNPLTQKGCFVLPTLPDYATQNGHLFYLVLPTVKKRQALIQHLRSNGIHAVFHYLSLHQSTFYQDKHDSRSLPHCDHFSDCLVRLPLFYELSDEEVTFIVQSIYEFYKS